MTQHPEPSPGALRAAKKAMGYCTTHNITSKDGFSAAVAAIARIIDAETGAAELAAVFEMAKIVVDESWQDGNGNACIQEENMEALRDVVIRTALALTEGEHS